MDITNEQLKQIHEELHRISNALERLASAQPIRPMEYIRELKDYYSFDWASINARVVHSDADGPTHVEYEGAVYLRRSPTNKYAPAVWFSRSAGQDEEGKTKYVTLITFKNFTDPDPMPEKIKNELQKGLQKEPSPAKPQPAPASTSAKIPEEQISPSAPVGSPARIRPPAEIKKFISSEADKYSTRTISPEKQSQISAAIDYCYANNPVTSQKHIRQKIYKYLTGEEHLSQIDHSLQIAMYIWLEPVETALTNTKTYMPSTRARAEVKGLWSFLSQM